MAHKIIYLSNPRPFPVGPFQDEDRNYVLLGFMLAAISGGVTGFVLAVALGVIF